MAACEGAHPRRLAAEHHVWVPVAALQVVALAAALAAALVGRVKGMSGSS